MGQPDAPAILSLSVTQTGRVSAIPEATSLPMTLVR
jgi:hypothetical protein